MPNHRKRLAAALCLATFLTTALPLAAAEPTPSAQAAPASAQIIALVHQATAALNNVARSGATKAEAEQLFGLYTADFVYEHEKYGGQYSRELLYRNTLRMIEKGSDNLRSDRYQIIQILPGLASAAVLRQTRDGKQHLAMFEFKGDKISKIKEYW